MVVVGVGDEVECMLVECWLIGVVFYDYMDELWKCDFGLVDCLGDCFVGIGGGELGVVGV